MKIKSYFDGLTKEEIKQLVERYPFLNPYNVFTGKLPDDYDYTYIFGLETPVGWDRLLLQMFEDIRQPLIDNNFLDKFRWFQIKEKYGSLRAYHNGAPKEVCDIIDKYEQMSYYVCTKCGKLATWETNGWIVPLCEECYKNAVINKKGNNIEFQDYYIVRRYDKDNDRYIDEKISFRDEWDRYLERLKNNL